MTVDEIFSVLSEHMVEGLMTHSQLSDYFGFLGLEGYQKCHKYHYFEENNNYKKLCDYFLKHYDKIVAEKPFSNPNIIPSSWYQYTRYDVNNQTRKTAIQTGFEKWVEWEQETKNLYEKHYQDLIDLNEIAAAKELEDYIIEVDEELAEANQKYLTLVANDFNISDIITEQEYLFNKYSDKLKEIKL